MYSFIKLSAYFQKQFQINRSKNPHKLQISRIQAKKLQQHANETNYNKT